VKKTEKTAEPTAADLYAELEALDNETLRLEARAERRQRRLDLLLAGDLAHFGPDEDLSPAAARAELDRVQGELNEVTRRRAALMAQIDAKECAERKAAAQETLSSYRAAVRRYLQALLTLAQEARSMESLRRGWSSSTLRPINLPGLNHAALRTGDPHSNLASLIRELVHHDLLSPGDKLLSGVVWAYTGA
jgi:hypothetical protein